MPKAVTGLADLARHTVLIVGVGREGSALATALQRFTPPPVMMALEGVEGDHAARFRTTWGDAIPLFVIGGEETPVPEAVATATLAVMSPGIAKTSGLYRFIQQLGIPMTSGSALFVADHSATLVGVTGSKGKSTTTTLIHRLLELSGESVSLGGNMGIPLQGIDPLERQVAELSSYQCHYLEVSPDVVVLTALFPEHLDWHGSSDQYFADKLSIAAHGPRKVVANGDDEVLRDELTSRFPELEVEWVGTGHPWHLEAEGDNSWLCHGDKRLYSTADSRLLGVHNHRNMLLALAGAQATGALDHNAIGPAFSEFDGLAHRLERIEDPSGLLFINDSLATNPQAAIAALQACSSPGMVWLVGGFDRGVDYQPLVDQVVASRPRHIIGLPGSGASLVELFRTALAEVGHREEVTLTTVESMQEALVWARMLAQPGDYVLLSPGAPSFGYYRDYQHRAEDFRSAIDNTQPKDTA